MAKKDVTLSAEEWTLTYNHIRSSAAADTVDMQLKQFRICERLEQIARNAEGPEYTVGLLGWERKLINEMVSTATPSGAWTVRGLAVMWHIREAMGWKRPEFEEPDEEEAE